MFSAKKWLRGAAAALALGSLGAPAAQAQETIKVGVLHSLSGTMAISETTLKDVMLMLIEEQNAKGGLLGKKLEPVVVDPASDWPLFAEKMRDLVSAQKVAAVFCCWTSVSRKSILPVAEELDTVVFYPVQYEGEESSKNIFYTGAAPNQQAIPAVDYMMEEGVKRWVLEGTDYVYPRTTNKILEAYLLSKGVPAEDIPVMAFSVGEEELAGIDTAPLVGHLAAWNYFQSVDTPENAAFIKAWHAYIKNDKRVTNDPMEAHFIGFNLWVKAVEKAGTTDPDKVIDAMVGLSVPNLSGGMATMGKNHHITKPTLIGEIQADGQFEVVKEIPAVEGDAWSDFLPESKPLVADWTDPIRCGNYNSETKTCGGSVKAN